MAQVKRVYDWNSKPVKEDAKHIFYESVVIEESDSSTRKFVVKVGDTVLLGTNEDQNFVAKITSLFEVKSTRVKRFNHIWLYTPADLATLSMAVKPVMEERELLFSNHEDVNDVETIAKVCQVVCFPPSMPPPLWLKTRNDIFFARNELQMKPLPIKMRALSDAIIEKELRERYVRFNKRFRRILRGCKDFWQHFVVLKESILGFDIEDVDDEESNASKRRRSTDDASAPEPKKAKAQAPVMEPVAPIAANETVTLVMKDAEGNTYSAESLVSVGSFAPNTPMLAPADGLAKPSRKQYMMLQEVSLLRPQGPSIGTQHLPEVLSSPSMSLSPHARMPLEPKPRSPREDARHDSKVGPGVAVIPSLQSRPYINVEQFTKNRIWSANLLDDQTLDGFLAAAQAKCMALMRRALLDHYAEQDRVGLMVDGAMVVLNNDLVPFAMTCLFESKMDQTKALAEVEGALPVQLTIWTLAEQQTAHNLFRKHEAKDNGSRLRHVMKNELPRKTYKEINHYINAYLRSAADLEDELTTEPSAVDYFRSKGAWPAAVTKNSTHSPAEALSFLVRFRQQFDELSCHALFGIFLAWNSQFLSAAELVIRVLKILGAAVLDGTGTDRFSPAACEAKMSAFAFFKTLLPPDLARSLAYPVLERN